MPILLCIAVLVADQLSKLYIQSSMTLGMSVPVVPHVFHITYILNPGAAFGILANQRWFFLLTGFALIAAAVYFYAWIRQQHAYIRYGTSLLLGGAAGNLFDRILGSGVVDFLDFRIWPVFNLADIAIVAGVGCIIYAVLFKMKEKRD